MKQWRDIEQFIRFARAYCANRLPWFAPAVFACRIHLTESVPVAAISERLDIFFNPAAIQAIVRSQSKEEALAQTGFLWIHEISHVLREHATRAREHLAEPLLWNLACDMEINDSTWEGLRAPKALPPVLPITFDLPIGQLAEYYYRNLFGAAPLMDEIWDEGSGVHGHKRPWELDDHSPIASMDDVRLAQIRRQVAALIRQETGYGTIPGGWIRWADEQLASRTDWRKILRHRLRTAVVQRIGGRINYSLRRPARRQTVYQPLLPPSLNVDWSARLACVIDTSGSMSDHTIGQAIAEVMRILDSFHLPVTVVPCDATAYAPVLVRQKSDYRKIQTLPGGGGTDMVAGIATALALRPMPDAIVVLTDGYTPYPPQPVQVPVVFGIFQPRQGHKPEVPSTPPWPLGSVIFIPV